MLSPPHLQCGRAHYTNGLVMSVSYSIVALRDCLRRKEHAGQMPMHYYDMAVGVISEQWQPVCIMVGVGNSSRTIE